MSLTNSGEDKGWNWDGEKSVPTPEWAPEKVEPDTWIQMKINAAEWAAQGAKPQGWTQQHGGAAQWQ
jgi:hypothetical protein